MKNLRSNKKEFKQQSTSKTSNRGIIKTTEPTLPLSNFTLKRVPNSIIAKMNIECTTEQLERQLCPPDLATTIYDDYPSFLDSPPSVGSLESGSSSPLGSFGSDDYEDSFNREVNDLNCNDPLQTAVMTMGLDHTSWTLSPNSMAGSPAIDENDINIHNLEQRSRSDSLLLVPDTSMDVNYYSESTFFSFPTQEVKKIEEMLNGDEDLLNDNAELISDSVLDEQLDIDEVMGVLKQFSSQDNSSQESVDYVPDYPNLIVQQRQPIVDNFLQATASQLEGGIDVFELPSQPGPVSPSDSATISAGPSYIATSSEASSNESEESHEPKKRGRKRKNQPDEEQEYMTASQRKRQQNADAAKRYRMKKEIEARKVMEEREKVEKELEATRRKVQKKMDERNIMLKLIHDAYHEKDSSLRQTYKHIAFPKWLPKWIKNESEESDN